MGKIRLCAGTDPARVKRMKRLSAIVLSLLLLWVQASLVAQPVCAQAPAQCNCCRCDKGDCCVAKSPVDAAPLPAATVPAASQDLGLFSPTAPLVWLLPRGEAEDFLSAASSPLSAARVPLFTRHCALLI